METDSFREIVFYMTSKMDFAEYVEIFKLWIETSELTVQFKNMLDLDLVNANTSIVLKKL